MNAAAEHGILRRARLAPVALVRHRCAVAARAARARCDGDRLLGHVAALYAIVATRARAGLKGW